MKVKRTDISSVLFTFGIDLLSNYQGLRTLRGLSVGLAVEFVSAIGGLVSLILELLIGVFICLFNSSSLGIPGILGVFLGVGVLPIVAGSGIPGVGVAPFGKLVRTGAFELVVAGIRFPENSGGRFDKAAFELAVLRALPFVAADWQAIFKAVAQENKTNKVFFNIKSLDFSNLK